MTKQHYASIALIMMIFFISSCKKKSTTPATNTPSGAPAITSNFYFQAKIDGAWVTFQADNLTWGSGMGTISGGSGGNYYLAEYGFIENGLTSNSGGIGIVDDNVADPDDYPTRYSLFTLGSKTYGKYNNTPVISGAVVSYMVNGVEWHSDLTADQTGSAFAITEFIDNTIDAQSYKIVSATFNCKLYDGTGNVKTLTNGKFRGRIID